MKKLQFILTYQNLYRESRSYLRLSLIFYFKLNGSEYSVITQYQRNDRINGAEQYVDEIKIPMSGLMTKDEHSD